MDAIASLLVCLDAIYWVEFRILPIVSRRHGSVMICSLVISGSCFKTMSVDSALVDIYILSIEVNSFALSNALWRSDLLPTRFKNCLGRSLVDKGQRRVPDPPALIRTIILTL